MAAVFVATALRAAGTLGVRGHAWKRLRPKRCLWGPSDQSSEETENPKSLREQGAGREGRVISKWALGPPPSYQ